MTSIGPLLVSFAFFAVLFLVGLRLQVLEKRQRMQEKLKRERLREEGMTAALVLQALRVRGQGQAQNPELATTFGGGGSGQSRYMSQGGSA